MGLAYGRPLEAAGAVPVHLPFLNDMAGVLAVAGGVLLGFGSDIEPALCLALRVLVTGFASGGAAWVLGVQWELQESWKDDARFLGVFSAFVEAARDAPARPPAPLAAA